MKQKLILLILAIALFLPLCGDLTILLREGREYYSDGMLATFDGATGIIYNARTDHVILYEASQRVMVETTWTEYMSRAIAFIREKGAEQREETIKSLMEQAEMNREEAERYLAEMILGPPRTGEITKKKTGSETIAGFESDKWEIRYEGELARSAWISPKVMELLEAEGFDFSTRDRMNSALDDLVGEMRRAMVPGIEPRKEPLEEEMDLLAAQGYVMRMAEPGFQGMQTLREVNEVKTDAIDTSVFKKPPGFSEIPLKQYVELVFQPR